MNKIGEFMLDHSWIVMVVVLILMFVGVYFLIQELEQTGLKTMVESLWCGKEGC